MNVIDCDVLVVGSGFGGCLTALVAQRLGLRSALVDRNHHPRFAIGESTTPLANLVLEGLARRYDLPRLLPLANYASWRSAYPEMMRGLKRGFSYFRQEPGKPFGPRTDHSNELLVAASNGESDADTHWLRADVDQFFAQEAVGAGIPLFEDATCESLRRDRDGWQVDAQYPAGPLQFRARFLVDASGGGGWLAKPLGLTDASDTLQTHSRAVFAHFVGVQPWEPIYRREGGFAQDHPFPCDAAALHHVFEEGWMYQLRFDNGITSAGFCLDPRLAPEPSHLSADEEWEALLRRWPAVAEQFAQAWSVSHGGHVVRSQRLQRRFIPAAGPNWALLPHAAGFIDPLHSTGIAHTMFGIERLALAWERAWGRRELAEAMREYDRLMQLELRYIDRVVAGCYRGFSDFPRMTALTMFYFASAIWSEHRRRTSSNCPQAFLCADVFELQTALENSLHAVGDCTVSTADLTAYVAQSIAPFNLVGLCDPEKQNMYPYTA